jgi:hypothetical protein
MVYVPLSRPTKIRPFVRLSRGRVKKDLTSGIRLWYRVSPIPHPFIRAFVGCLRMPNAVESGRLENGQFAPGHSGRPKGLLASHTLEIKAFARMVLLGKNPTVYLENVRGRILRGEASHMERFFAEHLWGKPKDVLALEGGGHINILVVNYADVHGESSPGQDDRHSRALPPADVSTPISGDDAIRVQAWDARVAPPER